MRSPFAAQTVGSFDLVSSDNEDNDKDPMLISDFNFGSFNIQSMEAIKDENGITKTAEFPKWPKEKQN